MKAKNKNMEIWLARNKRGYLWCFDKEPVLGKYGDWESNGGNCISIGDFAILPDITFENSPQKAILEFVN